MLILSNARVTWTGQGGDARLSDALANWSDSLLRLSATVLWGDEAPGLQPALAPGRQEA